MNKRLISLITLFILCIVCAYSFEVHIAPMMYDDQTTDENRENRQVHDDILQNLRFVGTGFALNFSMVRDGSITPVSREEAITVSQINRSEYLLYGSVIERDNTVEAIIQLFDYEKGGVIKTFYGKDDHAHYERMIKEVSEKIITYFNETFNLGIIGEEPKYARLYIPVNIGYWTPMEADWTRLLLGTGLFHTGITFVPNDSLFTSMGKNFYLSTGFIATYRFGLGNPKAYKAYNHNIMMMIPVRMHIELSEQHSFFAGVGVMYVMDILTATQKYEDPKIFIYSNVGLELMLGYSCKLNDSISFYFNNAFDFVFSEHPMISYSPHIGVNISIYERRFGRR